MKEEKKLMKLELKNENQKLENIQISGLKLYFFNLVFQLLQINKENNFLEYFLVIVQFIQLIAFPMDFVFSFWRKNLWFGTVGHFFHYCQTLFILIDYSNFYLISFFIAVLYIIVFFILLILSIHNLKKYSYINKNILELISIIIQFNTILSIPFFKILFGIIICNEDNNIFKDNIKCHSKMHLIMIVISCISIIIYVILLYLFKSIYFEFGVTNKLKSCFTSSTEVLLLLTQLLLVILFQFAKNEIALSAITLILSFFIFFDYFGHQPYINKDLN